MRVDYINNEIMTALVEGFTVRYAPLSDGSYIFSRSGFVSYVLQRNDIYFSLEKCTLSHDSFKYLLNEHPVALLSENKLLPTLDVRVSNANKALLARLIAADWDTFVDMELLEAFDFPNMYQNNPLGAIAIIENNGLLCGYVMPTRTYQETSGHYNDPPKYDGD